MVCSLRWAAATARDTATRGSDPRKELSSYLLEDTLWAVAPSFVPHPALHNAHLMTVASYLIPRRWLGAGPRAGEERYFEVDPDNQVMARCHWQPDPMDAPTVVLLHGLSGSDASSYMVSLGGKCSRAGYNVLRLNMRNCGGTEHLATTLYHSGLSSDVEVVIDALVAEGHKKLFLVGFSMGGNIALRVAARSGGDGRAALQGAAVVSPAIDLACAVDNLDRGFANGLYRLAFMTHLRAALRRKARRFPGRFDLQGLGRVRTICEFDDRFTAPDFGFGDAANYYREASAMPLLGSIHVPTLMVQAIDDPMVPPSQVDHVVGLGNPAIEVLAPDAGGHCAFFSKCPAEGAGGRDPDRWWAENRVLEFLDRQLSAESKRNG